MNVSSSWQGDGIDAKLAAATDFANKSHFEAAQRAAQDVAQSDPLSGYAPVKSGAFAASIHGTAEEGGQQAERVSFSGSNPPARMLHGTQPHTITASGRALRFVGGEGGGVVYAYEVNHPGTAGSNYVQDAIAADDRQQQMQQLGKDLLAEMLQL